VRLPCVPARTAALGAPGSLRPRPSAVLAHPALSGWQACPSVLSAAPASALSCIALLLVSDVRMGLAARRCPHELLLSLCVRAAVAVCTSPHPYGSAWRDCPPSHYAGVLPRTCLQQPPQPVCGAHCVAVCISHPGSAKHGSRARFFSLQRLKSSPHDCIGLFALPALSVLIQ
jgi:hypothetical protein